MPELKTLLQSAVQQSPTMLAKSISIAKTEADRMVASAAMWPSLGGNVQYARTTTSISSGTTTATGGSTTTSGSTTTTTSGSTTTTTSGSTTRSDGPLYSFYFTQPIFYWGTLKAQSDIAKLDIKIAEHQYADAYRGVVSAIRSQYLGLIQKKSGLKNQRYRQRLAESAFDVLENKFKNGSASAGDLNGPRLDLAEARLGTERAEEDYESQKRTLARLSGVEAIADSSIPSEIPKPSFAPDIIGKFFEEMKREGIDGLFQSMVYKDTLKQNDLTYKIVKYRLFPKFAFQPSISQQNLTYGGNTPGSLNQVAITSTVVAIAANWTIFDGFATRGAKLSALATKRLNERNYQNFTEATLETARALEKQIVFAGRMMDIIETRSALAGAAVDQYTENVRLGTASPSTLEGATLTANGAQLQAMGTRADFFTKWSDYVSLLGVDPALNNLPSRYLHNAK